MNDENNVLPDNPSIQVLKAGQSGVFTNYIYKEIPLAFDESMSYYETLLGLLNYLQTVVIPTVNNNADAVAELQNLYIELKTYVDDYFTNLDVQQEINNKLDAMVEDGTIPSIIESFIIPYENQINETINDFDRRLSAVAIGSPLKATSISDMTDTTRTYVLTTDGYWYYYNGTNWVQGGLYQSTRLGNNSVQFENLSEQLQADSKSVSTITDDVAENDSFINNNLEVVSGSNFFAFVIDVNPYDYIQLNLAENLTLYGATNLVYAYGYNNEVVRIFTKSDVETENNRLITNLTIPENVDKLYINTTGFGNAITKISKYIKINIGMNQFDDLVKSLYEENYSSVELTPYLNGGYFLSNGQPVKLNGYTCYILPVNKGEKYKINAKQIYSNFVVGFASTNGVISKVIDGITYTTNCIVDKIQSSTSGATFTDEYFTIPDYCSAIYINKDNSDTSFKLEKLTSYQVKASNIDIDSLNPLNNKKLGFVGDSICAASTEGVKGWTGLIQENNQTASVYNYAHDGARISEVENRNYDVINQIQELYDEHPDLDYIIIQGGVNDVWGDVPIGTFNPTTDYNYPQYYNKSTFSGALEWIFNYCMTNYKGKKIGFICTHRVKWADDLDDYLEQAKKICKKWCIPYIDLYASSDLNMMIDVQRTSYSINSDGCHPNLNGYEIITPKIENWLKYNL